MVPNTVQFADLNRLGDRLQVVRRVLRDEARSDWAQSFWTTVERQLERQWQRAKIQTLGSEQ